MHIMQSRLKPLREKAKVSIHVLARTLNVPPDYLLAVEKQSLPANDRIRRAYVKLFGTPEGSDNKKPRLPHVKRPTSSSSGYGINLPKALRLT